VCGKSAASSTSSQTSYAAAGSKQKAESGKQMLFVLTPDSWFSPCHLEPAPQSSLLLHHPLSMLAYLPQFVKRHRDTLIRR